MARTVWAGVAGIGLAAAAHFLALMLGGGGHAWTEPFLFSFALWVMFPLVLVRVRLVLTGSEGLAWLDSLVLCAGLLLEVLLVASTGGAESRMSGTGTELFMRVLSMEPALVLLWILLWLSWQVAALYLCLAGLARDEGSRARARGDLESLAVAGGLGCGFVLICVAIVWFYAM